MNNHIRDIEQFIDRMNDDWLNDRTENLSRYFHKQVVMIQPGTQKKIVGREAMVDSYQEFIEEADVSDFRIKDLRIDVFENTAIVLYTFRIKYKVETTNYDEGGVEILVLNLHNEHWQIVWRNQQPDIDV
ncbi:nuclear transport factor 2 family protein [Balneolaceae bacterium YR4-1]|uniref:Nuclear transport factor 2 family protein n=1 Tax=Halalkalibaculum roseum TaxID=2709311 RepID=A0A6M1T3J9_9BACT|nr:nuclear transport factor 2 family protein [Halalkalibaculum roseum]NGP76555.1 nuclear transport factor 2 family protein [Halalkalibaculum roseum]